METNVIYNEDCLVGLKELPSESVNCVVTSPPYWALRDYGVDGQLGLESSPDEYISKLCDVFDEVKRVLRKDGTCFVNLGDSYYGSGKGVGGDSDKCKESYTLPKGWDRPSRKAFSETSIEKKCLECGKDIKTGVNGQFCSRVCLNKQSNDFRSQNRLLPDKCLVGIPARFQLEMVRRGWILRNVIIWHKPNCMPSSVKDRFTVDFEYVFFFVKSKNYFFEQQTEPRQDTWGGRWGKMPKGNRPNAMQGRKEMSKEEFEDHYGDKRNMRTMWSISTKSFSEAHFAVYPEELIEPMIRAGCPEFVCNKCGKPRENIYEVIGERVGSSYRPGEKYETGRPQRGEYKNKYSRKLSDCGCGEGFKGGIVLDPFFGAGTSGVVALKQGKKYLGFELNADYIEIAEKRLKPLREQRRLV